MVYLLDANVLIALTISEHEHHPRVSAWLATVERVALCPIAEGALVRFLIRVGDSPHAATEVLGQMYASARCEFCPDCVSYTDSDLSHVHGHRQVTAAYLVALVEAHAGSVLATLDDGLALDRPDHTRLVPAA